jgi:hypothetical protein
VQRPCRCGRGARHRGLRRRALGQCPAAVARPVPLTRASGCTRAPVADADPVAAAGPPDGPLGSARAWRAARRRPGGLGVGPQGPVDLEPVARPRAAASGATLRLQTPSTGSPVRSSGQAASTTRGEQCRLRGDCPPPSSRLSSHWRSGTRVGDLDAHQPPLPQSWSARLLEGLHEGAGDAAEDRADDLLQEARGRTPSAGAARPCRRVRASAVDTHSPSKRLNGPSTRAMRMRSGGLAVAGVEVRPHAMEVGCRCAPPVDRHRCAP